MAKKRLQQDVAGKYRVLDGHGIGEYQFKGSSIHLDHVNLEEADRLVSAGFPYLVALPAKTNKRKRS